MENVVSNNISNSNISRNVNIKNNLSQTNTQLLGSGANLMPTERQTSIGVFSPGAVTKSNMEIKRFSRSYSSDCILNLEKIGPEILDTISLPNLHGVDIKRLILNRYIIFNYNIIF